MISVGCHLHIHKIAKLSALAGLLTQVTWLRLSGSLGLPPSESEVYSPHSIPSTRRTQTQPLRSSRVISVRYSYSYSNSSYSYHSFGPTCLLSVALCLPLCSVKLFTLCVVGAPPPTTQPLSSFVVTKNNQMTRAWNINFTIHQWRAKQEKQKPNLGLPRHCLYKRTVSFGHHKQ